MKLLRSIFGKAAGTIIKHGITEAAGTSANKTESS